MPTAGQLRDLISGEPLAGQLSLCDVKAESLSPSGDVCRLRDQYECALSVCLVSQKGRLDDSKTTA